MTFSHEMLLAEEILYTANEWWIFAGLLVLMLVATEIGSWMGRRIRARLGDHAVSQITTIEGGVLGLLALLLAFTFSMSVARYDSRRELVVKEANAIGTAALRAQLLPEPARGDAAALFRQYVASRIELAHAAGDVNRWQASMITTERLQQQLWAVASSSLRSEPQNLGLSLLVASMNEVIDVHGERLAAHRNHVPEVILRLEMLVAIFAAGLVGYGSGVGGLRYRISTTMLAVVIPAVILLIIDLDRPGHGMIRVSQAAIEELRQSLETASPAP